MITTLSDKQNYRVTTTVLWDLLYRHLKWMMTVSGPQYSLKIICDNIMNYKRVFYMLIKHGKLWPNCHSSWLLGFCFQCFLVYFVVLSVPCVFVLFYLLSLCFWVNCCAFPNVFHLSTVVSTPTVCFSGCLFFTRCQVSCVSGLLPLFPPDVLTSHWLVHGLLLFCFWTAWLTSFVSLHQFVFIKPHSTLPPPRCVSSLGLRALLKGTWW